MKMLPKLSLLSLLFLLTGGLLPFENSTFQVIAQEPNLAAFQFKSATLDIKGKKRVVEFADTFPLRAQGLQFRSELCEECGMLFQFDRSRIVSMWMKNTLLPLDVAFFTESGVIIDIKPMQPLDLTSVPSSQPVIYALEMNQGWFAKNGIKAGDSIKILSTAPEYVKDTP